MPKPRGLIDEQFRWRNLVRSGIHWNNCPLTLILSSSESQCASSLIKNRLRLKDTDIHDIEVMDVLLDKEAGSDQDLYADSVYRSEAFEMACIKKGINSCIHEKRIPR
jgi:hypothetical protein